MGDLGSRFVSDCTSSIPNASGGTYPNRQSRTFIIGSNLHVTMPARADGTNVCTML